MISAQRTTNTSIETAKGERRSSPAVVAGQRQGKGSNTCLSTRPFSLDAQGFDTFYREQHGLIYGYVYRKLGNQQEAEDLTSSIFLKAVQPAARGRAGEDVPLAVAGGEYHDY